MSVKVGDPAPDFTMPTDEGEVSLKNYSGKRLVLYFYPKDDTSGCTAEAQTFRDDIDQYAKASAQILGVSRDSVASHVKFRAKHSLPFALGSDPEGKVCEAYGVWKEKKNYGRTYMGIERGTFLIDENGIVRAIWPKVKVAGHSTQVLAALANL